MTKRYTLRDKAGDVAFNEQDGLELYQDIINACCSVLEKRIYLYSSSPTAIFVGIDMIDELRKNIKAIRNLDK